MPVYKLVRLPDGKEIRLPKGASNRGGKTLYWAVENVDDKHHTYQEALGQLKAIKASQRRRALGIAKHPLIERTGPSRKRIHSQMTTLIDTASGRSRIIKISEYSRRSKLGKKHTVSEHQRHLRPRARKVVLRQNTFSPETDVFRPVVDEEIRRIARAQPEGRMRPEELKPYFSFRQKIIPPAAIPGRLTEEEMHQLGYTRPSLIEYLRWDRELEDFVVDNRLIHPNQPIQLIKGVDTEVAKNLNEMSIYTVGDYERAIRLFVDQNPDAISLAEARRKNIDERKLNLMRMWNQLTPQAQTEIFQKLDELSKLDPETVPVGFALRETELMVSEAFLKQKATEEAEARRLAEPRITKVGRPPKAERTIKQLMDERLNIMTDTRLSKGQRDRRAGRISREISRRKHTNKLIKLINHVEKLEGKGHFSELERFIIAKEAVEKPSVRAFNPFKKEAIETGQVTIGNISYQPRSIGKKRPKKEPIETLINNPENNIDTYIFIDKEPARQYVTTGRKARVYDPLYREGEDKFFLDNKQINFVKTKWRKGEKIIREGGRTYYDKDDINTVLAAIEDPHVPYIPASHIGEDTETRRLPYVIIGGHGQPLVFITKKGHFAIKPTKVVTDKPSKRMFRE